jgi:MinD-like ATPase involved in chromosome partitioning or flagellar assembly
MKTIAVVSGKGGVGKTTSAINLSAYLNHLGYNVLLVDANINTPDVGLSLGAPVVPISLQHVLSGKNNAEDAIYTHHSGTKVMPSSLSISSDIKNLGKVLGKIKNFDFVIIDSAAGLGEDVISVIKASDECIVVTNPELPALTGALKTIRAAEQLKKPISGILVTRKSKNQLSLKNVRAMLGYPILGIIPEDDKVKEAQLDKETLVNFPRSNASKGYKKLALKITGVRLDEKNFLGKIVDGLKNIRFSVDFRK